MKARIVHNANFAKLIQGSPLKAGLLEMATDIHRRASAFAPVLTSALRNSGRVEPLNDGYRVTFGSSRVRYARRRHFENKKNPQTLHYLSRAGDSVARGSKAKYFRGKA